MRRFAAGMVGLIATIAAWGYWQVATHANLQVSLYDVALRSDKQAYGSVAKADLTFNDAVGKFLATGRADGP